MQLFRKFRDSVQDRSVTFWEETERALLKSNLSMEQMFDNWITLERKSKRFHFTYTPEITMDSIAEISDDYVDELLYRSMENEEAQWLPYPNCVFQITRSDTTAEQAREIMFLMREDEINVRMTFFFYSLQYRSFQFSAELVVNKLNASTTGKVFTSPTMAYSEEHKVTEMAKVWKNLVGFVLAMLDADRILVESNAMRMTTLNGKKKRPKKILPVNEYKILKLGLPQHIRDKEKRELGEESVRQRFHWRRSHWRYFDKPRLDGKTKTRVRAHCAGDPSLGIIHKEYEVH